MALGALCLVAVGGCYERVVGAKGFGSDRYAIEQPYRSETFLDKAWDKGLGEKKPLVKQRWQSTPTFSKTPETSPNK